jgi:NADP-dependent 3-hydroxy acid dehydrogenase YdfG
MKRQNAGHIINVSSVAGHKVRPSNAVYAATKHVVRVISEGLRMEVKPCHIRTTVISPGAVATELPTSATEPDVVENLRKVYEKAIPAESFARTGCPLPTCPAAIRPFPAALHRAHADALAAAARSRYTPSKALP